jgi:hypothetical protein
VPLMTNSREGQQTMTTPKAALQDTEATLAAAWANFHDLRNELHAWPELVRAATEAADPAALGALFRRRAALKYEITIASLVTRQRAVEHWTVMLCQAEAEVVATREPGLAAQEDYTKGFSTPRDKQGNVVPPPPALVAYQRAQDAVAEARRSLTEAEGIRQTEIAAVAAVQ